jgi:hypothetical protein
MWRWPVLRFIAGQGWLLSSSQLGTQTSSVHRGCGQISEFPMGKGSGCPRYCGLYSLLAPSQAFCCSHAPPLSNCCWKGGLADGSPVCDCDIADSLLSSVSTRARPPVLGRRDCKGIRLSTDSPPMLQVLVRRRCAAGGNVWLGARPALPRHGVCSLRGPV